MIEIWPNCYEWIGCREKNSSQEECNNCPTKFICWTISCGGECETCQTEFYGIENSGIRTFCSCDSCRETIRRNFLCSLAEGYSIEEIKDKWRK